MTIKSCASVGADDLEIYCQSFDGNKLETSRFSESEDKNGENVIRELDAKYPRR